jgi:hypothetical protein
MPILCLKYNEVPQTYLKHIGSVTKKINKFVKITFKKIFTQELWLAEHL